MKEDAKAVWNRACTTGGRAAPMQGDAALAGMLLAHGLVMNGGVVHAVGCLSDAEMTAAGEAYRYFGFPHLAVLLFEARACESEGSAGQERELALDAAYGEAVGSDQVLAAAFEQRFAAEPARANAGERADALRADAERLLASLPGA